MEPTYSIQNSPYDIRDYKITAETNLPKEFSLTPPPVKNQGLKPTCVGFALSSAAAFHHHRQHGEYQEFSTEFIYAHREEGDTTGDGRNIRQALNCLLKYGTPFEADCPGNHDYEKAKEIIEANLEKYRKLAYPHRISAYFRINTEDELKTALMKYGVVIVSMNAYDISWLADDVYKYQESSKYGRHCVFIYGWNEKGWLVQNSWGKLYGWDGRFIIPFDFQLNEMWGIADDITEDFIKPKRNKWLDTFYKIINFFVNITKKK
jgi:hypothetical protein